MRPVKSSKLKATTVALVALVALLYTGCATEMGNHRHAQHGRDQIELTRVQVESRERMALDRAQAQANWALAMAQVAQASPETADAIAVALAVASVKGSSEETQGPVVQLQRMENSALEWTKALLPTVGNVVTGVGIAAINADVTKRQSDNMTKVQINEDNVDQAQYETLGNVASSVSTFAATAVQSAGGNTTYTVSDTGILDMSQSTSGDTISGDTNSDSYNTSGDTNTDSYNTTGDTNADSYNTQGDTTTDSSDTSDNSVTNPTGP
jgi:hypothetical protein